MNTIYLDNAATSFPKPEAVAQAMVRYLTEVGAPLNRSVYRNAQETELVTLSLRERLKGFFHFPEKATHVILTPGNTYGLNLIIKGYLRPGDHVIVSSMEHNAVMRPLLQLPEVSFDRVQADAEGFIDPHDIHALIRPNTRLILMAHGSNVAGSVQDAEAVGAIAAQYGIPFALDGAQTAGHFPLDFERFHLSALSVPGHKGLLGPSGIGALLLSDAMEKQLSPLIAGGTGSVSDSELLPEYLPDRFESGTMNLPGIYGWEAAMAYVSEVGMASLRAHELLLMRRFIHGVRDIPNVRLCGPKDLERRVGVFSLDFMDQDNAAVAFALEQRFGILIRCGLHCAPAAHRSLGTFPRGTVRFSLGYANTEADVDAAIAAIGALA
ncbi:MAG: aminotransferase class V-fold PLP-dependent enzyme [Clostridia bacterium]|nr:aminotransferase class V-fold PLP-dependent enzyme [Clostridia bacterium]